jgi:phytanoyl-CoA hydroxylase
LEGRFLRKLTQAQKDFFGENGFLAIEEVVPKKEVDVLRDRIEAIVRGDLEFPDQGFQVCDPKKYKGPGDNGEVMGIQLPGRHDPVFKRFLEHPNVVSVAKELLGPNIAVYTDQVIRKLPGFGKESGFATHFHQDGYYWRNSPPRTINFWYAVDDADERRGGMRFIPGSFRRGLMEHEAYWDDPMMHSLVTGKAFNRWGVPESEVDRSKEVSTPIKAGSCVCFGTLTFHASFPNLGSELHRAYAIAFMEVAQK